MMPTKTFDPPLIIGIDPDREKSGVAIYNRETKVLELKALPFFSLFDFLNANKENIDTVKIEAGWLNQKSNFRTGFAKNISEKIARDVGANQETGKKIVEMCEYTGHSFRLVKPLKKIWKSKDGKINDEEFCTLLKRLNIVCQTKRTNQDLRDSALICIF